MTDAPPPPAPTGGTWVVIAAYNEEARVGATLRGLFDRGYDRVVVVDDGSHDRTADVALRTPAWVLRHPVNLGQGAALQTGIAFALRHAPAAVVTFDADGQHDPAEVERVAAPVLAGAADIAMGSRFLGRAENIPRSRRLLLKGAVLFTWATSGVRVTDTHNGFRALSGAAAAKLRITQNRMAHASEFYDFIRDHRLRYVEVPVTIRYTADTLAKGQSSWNAVKIAAQVLAGRFVR